MQLALVHSTACTALDRPRSSSGLPSPGRLSALPPAWRAGLPHRSRVSATGQRFSRRRCGCRTEARHRATARREASTSTTTARARSDLGCSLTAPPGSVEGIERQVPRLLFCRVGFCDQDRSATPLCSRLPPEAECLVTARAGQARRSAGSSPLVSPQPPSALPS